MINVQRMVKDIKKLVEEANMMITEIKGTILIVNINNRMMNATNIAGISEDLRYMVQSNMEDWEYQIQRILADKLNKYKERGNKYVDENI